MLKKRAFKDREESKGEQFSADYSGKETKRRLRLEETAPSLSGMTSLGFTHHLSA